MCLASLLQTLYFFYEVLHSKIIESLIKFKPEGLLVAFLYLEQTLKQYRMYMMINSIGHKA